MKESNRALVFTSLGHFVNDGFLVLFPVLSMYYLSLGINATAIGILGAVYNFLSGFLGAPIGRMGDRSGKYAELMFLGFLLIFLSGLFYVLSFLIPGILIRYVFVSLASLFLGSGLGFYHPLGGAILQHTYRKEEAPKALGINGSMGSLGRAIAPYILVVMLDDLGVSRGLLAVSLLTLLLSFITYYGLKGVKFEPQSVSSSTSQASSLRPYMYVLLPLTVIVFVRSMFIAGVQLFAPSYLFELYRSHYVAGVFLTISYATAIVGQPYFGRLTSQKGGRFVVIVTTLLSTLFYLTFLFLKNYYAQLLSFALFAFFAFSGFPNLLGYVSQVVDRSVFARANGVVWSYGNMLGGALGMILGGPAVSYFGYFYGMLVYGLLGVVSSALLLMLPATKKAEAQA
ncbi:MAG: MFS transporter [Nitrososphaeria archaeon]|nr:MFS transporter [Conexivisphaerales archaeon]